MSDVLQDSALEILANSGWLATFVLGVLGWLGRTALGRYATQLDEVIKIVAQMDKRLARIEGRFEQQDSER